MAGLGCLTPPEPMSSEVSPTIHPRRIKKQPIELDSIEPSPEPHRWPLMAHNYPDTEVNKMRVRAAR